MIDCELFTRTIMLLFIVLLVSVGLTIRVFTFVRNTLKRSQRHQHRPAHMDPRQAHRLRAVAIKQACLYSAIPSRGSPTRRIQVFGIELVGVSMISLLRKDFSIQYW